MFNKRQILGQSGESKASRYLKKQGFKIIARNYHCRHGEIDLIAKDGDIIVFVEVKTRSQQLFGDPAASVNRRKQIQISKVAYNYMVENTLDDVDARFDVVSILMLQGKKPVIQHIKDAFEFCIH